jgi:hypothetical protein
MSTYFRNLVGLIGLVCWFTSSNCTAKNTNVDDRVPYRLEVQGLAVTYRVPADFKPGYSGIKRKLDFAHPESDKAAFPLGDGEFVKYVGTFYSGVIGDFKNWNRTLALFVDNIQPGKAGFSTVEEVAKVAERRYSKKYVLAGGVELSDFGSVSIDKIGDWRCVVVYSADSTRIKNIKTADGAELTLEPRMIGLIRVNDATVLGIQISIDNASYLTPQSYASTLATFRTIIESVHVESL